MENIDIKKYMKSENEFADLDSDKIVSALSDFIKCKTVSYEDEALMSDIEFQKLHKKIEEHFPLVHKNLNKTVINNWTLLYEWKGSDSSLLPALYMAHIDVVPVMDGTEADWEFDAFSGEISEDYIWGRGTLDTKGLVAAELSSVEYLLSKGKKPNRTIYLMFGHDEETMGKNGSHSAMMYLKNNGVKLAYVLDEGGGFKKGDVFGAPNELLAKVDIFEKGYVDIEVLGKSEGGHSSAPGKGTILGKVCKAMAAIEDNQLTAKCGNLLSTMLKSLAPIITEEPLKSLVEDVDKNKKEIAKFMEDEKEFASLVKTTTALTMMSGSPAPNVLPQTARGLINFRIAEGETPESVLAHCKKVVLDVGISEDDVTLSITKGMLPSKVSDDTSEWFLALKSTIEKYFENITVIPSMSVGGTDAQYFEQICSCCYRFGPFIDQMPLHTTIHATNERCYIPSLIHGTKVVLDLMSSTCFE